MALKESMKNRVQLRPRNLKTSEQVHRKTRAALLKSAPTPPKRILVPIDFSQRSNEALDYALSFAKQFRARVILMHVVEAFPIDYLLGLKEAETANQWLIEQSRERLGEVAKRLTRASLGRVEVVVSFGKPFQQIAEAAQARAKQSDCRNLQQAEHRPDYHLHSRTHRNPKSLAWQHR